jgi:hypothetical protein
MRIRAPLLVLLLLATACAAAPPAPPLFDVHVGFWVNLHQRLYAESGQRPVPDRLVAATPDEQAIWDGAVAAYRTRYPTRDVMTLLTNAELVRANQTLSLAEAAADLDATDVPAPLRAILAAAAPVYRRHAWPADERAGRALVARVTPLVARLGPTLRATLAGTYRATWPAAPIRVDVAAYAGPFGAYTVDDPAHITIAGPDPRHAGDAALEILFHEASHLLVEPLERGLAAAYAARAEPVPPTLWHAVLFYTTGERVRRQLGAAYVTYADGNDLWTRAPDWAAYRPLLERYWQPYLDGTTSFDQALAALADALT